MPEVGRLGLDQSHTPFRQLSLDTIDKAEAKLREITCMLDEPRKEDLDGVRKDLEAVAKLTNEFFSLLPVGDQVAHLPGT